MKKNIPEEDQYEEFIDPSLKYKEYAERVRAYLKGEIKEPKFLPATGTKNLKKGYIRKTIVIRPVYDDLLLSYAADQNMELGDVIEKIFSEFFEDKKIKPIPERVFAALTRNRKVRKKED